VPAFIGAWISETTLLVVGAVMFACMGAAALAGRAARHRLLAKRGRDIGEPEWAMASSVLGLLALLMGFTFSLAVERYEARRVLVLQEANAIDGVYQRAQMLDQAHRDAITTTLRQYTRNRIALAQARRRDVPPMLRTSDQKMSELWAQVGRAFPGIANGDFATSLVDAMTNLAALDAARRAERGAHVPREVFGILFIYTIVASAFLGYVASGLHGRAGATIVLVLLTLSLLLIVDIDRPTMGGIRENQGAMQTLAVRIGAD
jgi:hypothetical protein